MTDIGKPIFNDTKTVSEEDNQVNNLQVIQERQEAEEISKLKLQMEALLKAHEETQKVMELLQSNNEKLQNDNQRLEERLAQQEEKFQRMEIGTKILQISRDQLSEEKQIMQEELQQQKKQVVDFKQQLQSVNTELNNVKLDNQRLTKSNNSLEEDLHMLQEENQLLQNTKPSSPQEIFNMVNLEDDEVSLVSDDQEFWTEFKERIDYRINPLRIIQAKFEPVIINNPPKVLPVINSTVRPPENYQPVIASATVDFRLPSSKKEDKWQWRGPHK